MISETVVAVVNIAFVGAVSLLFKETLGFDADAA